MVHIRKTHIGQQNAGPELSLLKVCFSCGFLYLQHHIMFPFTAQLCSRTGKYEYILRDFLQTKDVNMKKWRPKISYHVGWCHICIARCHNLSLWCWFLIFLSLALTQFAEKQTSNFCLKWMVHTKLKLFSIFFFLFRKVVALKNPQS